jgi:hypothetical protein
MIIVESKQKSERGAVALMMVILLTSLIALFGVGLAVMNLDYSLGVASTLLGKNLTTAATGCLDSALVELANNNAVSTLNVNSIGGQNANCVVTIKSSGNYRYVTARATTTASFINSVAVASSTVNVATNPFTVVSSVVDTTAVKPSATFAANNNINIGSSSGLYATVSVDGGFAYVSYRDGAASNKLTVTKVNLSTFAVVTSLQNISSTAATFEDSVIHRGYLYVSYRMFTNVAGSDCKLAIARIDLNNFTSGGVTTLESLTNGCTGTNCIASPDAIAAAGDYVYIAFRDLGNSDKMGLKRFNINDFTTNGITTLSNITTGNPINPDMVIYNGYAYIAVEDYGAGAPFLKRVNLTDFSTVTSLNMDSGLACTYIAVTAVDNYIYYAWDEYNNNRNVSVARVSVNAFTKGTTLRATPKANYLDMVSADGYLYISTNTSGNADVYSMKIDTRTFTVVGNIQPLSTGDLYERPHLDAPGGSYIYQAHYDRGAARAKLFRIKVD